MPVEKSTLARTSVAECILNVAQAGVRDPEALRVAGIGKSESG
jgi:hypothetical protein